MEFKKQRRYGTVRYRYLYLYRTIFFKSHTVFLKKSLPVLQDSKEMVRYRYGTVLYIKKLSTLNPLPMGVRQYYRIVLVPVLYRYLKDDDYHLLSLSLRYGTLRYRYLYHIIPRDSKMVPYRYQVPDTVQWFFKNYSHRIRFLRT